RISQVKIANETSLGTHSANEGAKHNSLILEPEERKFTRSKREGRRRNGTLIINSYFNELPSWLRLLEHSASRLQLPEYPSWEDLPAGSSPWRGSNLACEIPRCDRLA